MTRKVSSLASATSLSALVMALTVNAQAGTFQFFPFDNGVGRGKWTPAQQAQTLKEVGFDGIGYNYTTPADIDVWQAELKSRGLKLFSIYIDGYPSKAPGMKEAIAKLKGTDTVIWLKILQNKEKALRDEEVAKTVTEISDMAAEAGLKVVLYGHKGFYVATAEDGLRIAEKVNRPNVGVTVNLCHELMAGNGDRIDEIIRKAAPRLMMVSINGADKDGKPDGYILTLDRGSFDVAHMLKTLQEVGYKGPVGLQCFSIKGDIRENLVRSLDAWKKMTATLENKENK